MTKFKHFALLLLAAITMFGCSSDYDDSGIKKDISDLQSRVEKLEKWCDTANGQITSLQGLVTALQNNDYVTGVTPVMEGTTEVGYTISFTKSSPITIMHGKNGTSGTNGKDGSTPIIGVKKHTDGLYYWTIQTGIAEADWMKDADGNMIPTTGKDGGAAQKPVINIVKDGDRYYWQIDGKWLEDADGNKIPATGDKGDTGAAGSDGTNGTNGTNGDSFFESVAPDTAKGTVVIKLTGGTEFTLPMLSTTVSFDDYTPLQIAATGTETAVTVTLPTSLKKADFAAIKADITNVVGTNSAISRAATEKWTIDLKAPTFKQDGTLDKQPEVKVTVPATATAGETALLEVTVVDAKGNKSSSTRVLYYDNIVAVTGVTLAPATTTLKVGKTTTLTVTVIPTEATNKTVTWTSSDAAIATVNATTGEVEGKTAGEVTITATSTEYPNIKGTCKVKVEDKPSITWAKGNLVAKTDGTGCEIGTATDRGLFFQFGSLVGWSATGDPTIAVSPAGYKGGTTWNGSWEGDPATENTATGTGDPCKYYLGGTWRLPTLEDYKALFNNVIPPYPWSDTGGWNWDYKSKSIIHSDGLKFQVSGYRYESSGYLSNEEVYGYYWSASVTSKGYSGHILFFCRDFAKPDGEFNRPQGLVVRCVQESN